MNFIFAILSIVFTSYFLLSLVIVQMKQASLFFIEHPISRHMLGDWGRCLKVGVCLFGVSDFFIAVLIFDVWLFPAILLVLAGCGIMVAALFDMDINGKSTVIGKIHNASAVSQFALFPFIVWFSSDIFGKEYALFLKSYAIVLLLPSLFLGLVASGMMADTKKIFGLIQKINLLLIIVWMDIISVFYIFSLFHRNRLALV
jgi:hypothetical protein